MCGNCYIGKVYSNQAHNTKYRLQFNGRSNLKVFKEKAGFVNPKHLEKYNKLKKSAAGDI